MNGEYEEKNSSIGLNPKELHYQTLNFQFDQLSVL